jgi:hypothetical protein
MKIKSICKRMSLYKNALSMFRFIKTQKNLAYIAISKSILQSIIFGTVIITSFQSCCFKERSVSIKKRKPISDLIDMQVRFVDQKEIDYSSYPWLGQSLQSIKVEFQFTNKTENILYIRFAINNSQFSYVPPPTINLGGNCGLNFGRGKNIEDNQVLLNPKEKITLNTEYWNCDKYQGPIRFIYAANIYDSSKRIISTQNDSLISNKIVIPKFIR